MVALSSRFVILASICCLAAITDCAVINRDTLSSLPHSSGSVASNKSAKKHTQAPMLSLPPNAKQLVSSFKKSKGGKKSSGNGKGKKHHKGHKRSIVISDNNRGASYAIPHSRRGGVAKRDQAGSPGTIDIMSAVYNSPTGKKLGSLYTEPNTNSANDTAAFVLNASDTNQTEVYLITAPSMTQANDGEQSVNLQVPLSPSSRLGPGPYCATFDPNPPEPEPLTVEPCFSSSSVTLHKSQVFAYNSKSGVIRPMWFNGEDDGMSAASATTEDPTTPSSGNVASVTDADTPANSTTVNNGTMDGNNTSLAARDDPASVGAGVGTPAQNVTLVFTPSNPVVQSGSLKAASDLDNQNSTTTGTTMTTTVTSTATATSTVTVAGVMEATSSAGVSSSSMTGTAASALPMTTSINAMVAAVESESPSGVSSSNSLSPSSSVESSSSASAAASAVPTTSTELKVQVVGPSSPATAPAPASPPSSIIPVPNATNKVAATAPTTTSAGVNAEAIASSIAASPTVGLSSSSPSSPPSSTAAPSVEAADTTSSLSSPPSVGSTTASQPMMTPVSTAPYEWMFKPEPRL